MLGKQFISFSVIGGVGFIVDTGMLYLLIYAIDVNLYLGRIFSYLCAVTVTWVLNRTYTFKVDDQPVFHASLLKQWSKFAGCNALGAVINYTIYALLITFISVFYKNPVFAVAIGTLFSVNVNFFLSKKYVF